MIQNISGNLHAKPTVKVGFVVKSVGYKGEIKISLENDDFADAIQELETLFIVIDGKWVPYKIENFNEHAWIVKLLHIDSDKEAELLKGNEIHLFEEDLEPSSKSELPIIGFIVKDAQQNTIGKITDVTELPGHLLLNVQSENKELLIPFHQTLVISLDENQKILVIEIAEGLLDL
jgi:16S rRNA processing protein RimM